MLLTLFTNLVFLLVLGLVVFFLLSFIIRLLPDWHYCVVSLDLDSGEHCLLLTRIRGVSPDSVTSRPWVCFRFYDTYSEAFDEFKRLLPLFSWFFVSNNVKKLAYFPTLPDELFRSPSAPTPADDDI